tara:strand:+ start:48924 stop:49199 length:276 start_codon:yes stop_codon:yes gene_type:complete
MDNKHYVYMLECTNGAYYTGYTIDLERRYQEHCEGSPKCKFTRSFPPVRLAASWVLETKTEALQLEAKIKKMSRKEKLAYMGEWSIDKKPS